MHHGTMKRTWNCRTSKKNYKENLHSQLKKIQHPSSVFPFTFFSPPSTDCNYYFSKAVIVLVWQLWFRRIYNTKAGVLKCEQLKRWWVGWIVSYFSWMKVDKPVKKCGMKNNNHSGNISNNKSTSSHHIVSR